MQRTNSELQPYQRQLRMITNYDPTALIRIESKD
jgi:hypothetical protein